MDGGDLIRIRTCVDVETFKSGKSTDSKVSGYVWTGPKINYFSINLLRFYHECKVAHKVMAECATDILTTF